MAIDIDGAELDNLLLRSQIEHEPGRYELWIQLGQMLRNDGDSSEAIAAFERAVELKPDESVAWLYLALTYKSANRVEEAGRAWQQVTDLQAVFVDGDFLPLFS